MCVPSPFVLNVLGCDFGSAGQFTINGKVEVPGHRLTGYFVRMSSRYTGGPSTHYNFAAIKDNSVDPKLWVEIGVYGFAMVPQKDVDRLVEETSR